MPLINRDFIIIIIAFIITVVIKITVYAILLAVKIRNTFSSLLKAKKNIVYLFNVVDIK